LTPAGTCFGVSAVLSCRTARALFRFPPEHESLGVPVVLLLLVLSSLYFSAMEVLVSTVSAVS
jgi:hypothetical protein